MDQFSSETYGTQWESHIGINNLAKVGGSEKQSFEPIKSPHSIVTPLHTPAIISTSASRTHMSFQAQHDQYQIDIPSWSFEFPKTTSDSPIEFCHVSGDNFTTTTKQHQSTTSPFTGSLHSVAESFLSSSEDSYSSPENFGELPSYLGKYSNFPSDKVLVDDAVPDERPLEISFQRNQLASFTEPDKQSTLPWEVACVTSSGSLSRGTAAGKRRIRWTKDLHEQFIMIVNRLGGPEKAKPKAILEMMGSNVLTISHVKSHLQKYRSTLYMHKALQEKSEEGHRTNGITELQAKIQMQIEESRQLQLEVQRSIHQQLEMQRNLQLLIEQQRKLLKLMLDHQKQRTKWRKSLTQSQNWK